MVLRFCKYNHLSVRTFIFCEVQRIYFYIPVRNICHHILVEMIMLALGVQFSGCIPRTYNSKPITASPPRQCCMLTPINFGFFHSFIRTLRPNLVTLSRAYGGI